MKQLGDIKNHHRGIILDQVIQNTYESKHAGEKISNEIFGKVSGSDLGCLLDTLKEV